MRALPIKRYLNGEILIQSGLCGLSLQGFQNVHLYAKTGWADFTEGPHFWFLWLPGRPGDISSFSFLTEKGQSRAVLLVLLLCHLIEVPWTLPRVNVKHVGKASAAYTSHPRTSAPQGHPVAGNLPIAPTLYHSPSLKSEKIQRGMFRGKGRVQGLATKALFIQGKTANAVNQLIKQRKERKKNHFHTQKSENNEMGEKGSTSL